MWPYRWLSTCETLTLSLYTSTPLALKLRRWQAIYASLLSRKTFFLDVDNLYHTISSGATAQDKPWFLSQFVSINSCPMNTSLQFLTCIILRSPSISYSYRILLVFVFLLDHKIFILLAILLSFVRLTCPRQVILTDLRYFHFLLKPRVLIFSSAFINSHRTLVYEFS